MYPHDRGKQPFSSYRGRGRGGRGRGEERVLGQIAHQRLIAANIASSSSSNNDKKSIYNDPEYQEFLAYKAGKTGESSTSYVNIVTNEDSELDDCFEQSPYKEIILLLEYKDLKWKDQPWTLMQRYLDTGSYPTNAYKSRQYYESILDVTKTGDFQHYTTGHTQNYNFSKIVIKQIISVEEWGTSPLKEKEMIHPISKVPIKFNYWDYIEAFNKAFLYENLKRKHSWFFKICPNVYNSDIPNWFYKWWISYGPSMKILPEPFKGYYSKWVEISPQIIEAQHENKIIEGMSSLHYFVQFGIPWIWKWSPEVSYTTQQIPCLKRIFYTKWWKKMLRKNDNGIIECQETIDKIESSIELYSEQIRLQSQRDSPSPFQQIARKIRMVDNQISREDFMNKYFEEIKKDIEKNFPSQGTENMSLSTNEEDEEYLAGESQYEEEDIMIDNEEIDKRIENLKETMMQNTGKEQGAKKKGSTSQ